MCTIDKINSIWIIFYNFYFEILLKLRQTRKMSKQNVPQELFIKVKQRLDYHRLPAQFPIEATTLINKLLSRIDGNTQNQITNSASIFPEQVDSALRFQIARVVKQNNELHLDNINLKQQVQSLEHRLYKHDSNKYSNKAEFERYQKMKENREEELVNELRQLRYKYNELMDFLHEDPQQEREYIKRLMKHKHSTVEQQQNQNHKQPKKGDNFIEEDQNNKIKQLGQKISNRDQQIARLHKHLQYDGVNLNKLIYNFNKHLVQQQLNRADNKIQYLETSYDKIKKENSKMKSNNGSKQALRAEVQNCHQIIQKLKKENNQLKRNSQEQVFNLQRRTSENDRTLKNVKNQKQNSDNINAKNQLIIRDLNKRIEFLQKELEQSRKIVEISEQKIAGLQKDKENLLKKLEQTRVFLQYELQNSKKKINELEFEINESSIKNKEINKDLDLIFRQSQLKSESINNLQKIVDELIKKNNLIAAEASFRRCDDMDLKKRLIELQQKLIGCHNQKIETQIKLRTVQSHFEQLLKQRQILKYVN